MDIQERAAQQRNFENDIIENYRLELLSKKDDSSFPKDFQTRLSLLEGTLLEKSADMLNSSSYITSIERFMKLLG